jgi:hypothetical protein
MRTRSGGPVTNERRAEIQRDVRRQLCQHLRLALEGDEYLMKECWESLASEEELYEADAELQRICLLIMGLGVPS